jgi:hypothetical protein
MRRRAGGDRTSREEMPSFWRFLATSRKLDRRPAGSLANAAVVDRAAAVQREGERPKVRMADVDGALHTIAEVEPRRH